MALPPGIESLMAAIPPMGRSAPSPGMMASPSPMASPAVSASPAAGVASPLGPGASPGGGAGGDIFAAAANSRLSQAGSVDPQYFIDQLTQMKHVVSGMLPKALTRFPAQADRQLQNLLRAIDSTTKAFQDAAQYETASKGGGGTIDFSGARLGTPASLPASV